MGFEQHVTFSNGQAEKAILGEALTIIIIVFDFGFRYREHVYAEQGQGNQALGFCRTAAMKVDWVSGTRDSA
jgi:hypothetical protein